MGASAKSVDHTLLEHVTKKIVEEMAQPRRLNQLGDMCLAAYVTGEPSEVSDCVVDVVNYDGPDDWDIERCAGWLNDRELLENAVSGVMR